MKKTLGENITLVLSEVEDTIWEREATCPGLMVEWPKEALPASLKIFMSVMLENLWALQEAENMPIEQRGEMAESMGKEISRLVFTYTGIDTKKLYQ